MNQRKKTKKRLNFWVEDDEFDMLGMLSKLMKQSKTNIVRQLIREKAESSIDTSLSTADIDLNAILSHIDTKLLLKLMSKTLNKEGDEKK